MFLERRSLHDLERNAMVAVFLRHVEYYRGILFLTTNRITAFDEAFLSRIHVALHFGELAPPARAQVWRAFLQKVGVDISSENDDDSRVNETQLAALAERDINGRQIKNATRTASSLAAGRGEKLAYSHLVETLDAMEEFTVEFKAMTERATSSRVSSLRKMRIAALFPPDCSRWKKCADWLSAPQCKADEIVVVFQHDNVRRRVDADE